MQGKMIPGGIPFLGRFSDPTEKTLKGKGTYVLILFLERAKRIQVGRLGKFYFPKGYFTYVGSALSPAGLTGRIIHHLNPIRRAHWHIDYLRKETGLVGVWFSLQPDRREHSWASLFRDMEKARVVVPGFGCSDCTCASHLFYFRKRPCLDEIRRIIHKRFPRDRQIQGLTDHLWSASTRMKDT
jgi:Uri superfamily endonuclease